MVGFQGIKFESHMAQAHTYLAQLGSWFLITIFLAPKEKEIVKISEPKKRKKTFVLFYSDYR